jgi:hypothetical protein
LALYLPLLSPLATVAVVMIGFLYNNSRLTDLRWSMGDMRDMLRAEIKVLQTIMDKNQSEVLSKFAELEIRVIRIEEKIH